jgi:ABC-type bacteriocin/lantibiotic exporter with double-glycine peptidase domain
VNGRLLLIDAGLVVVAVALLLLLSPGLAIVAIIALVVLAVCGISFAVQAVARRRRRRKIP